MASRSLSAVPVGVGGCGFSRRRTWIVRAASCRTVRDASERDCVALTGDTEDRDMLERLRYWILFPDSWVTFGLSRGTRHRWISQSSASLPGAPPTGLRINAPFYLCAEQGDSSQAASPSIQKTGGYSHVHLGNESRITSPLSSSSSSCSFATQQLWRGAGRGVEPGVRQDSSRKRAAHPTQWIAPCFPSSHLQRNCYS